MKNKEKTIWVYGTHLHCKECGLEVIPLCRIPYNTEDGVSAIGVCKRCGLLVIQQENLKELKWIKV